jgi:viroplasmin and RNaseH domain-containing protein
MEGKKQESLRPGREKKQEPLRPGRGKAGIFKTWKGKNRNLSDLEGKKAGIFKNWKGKSRNL